MSGNDTPQRFTAAHLRALTALLSGATGAEAAAAAGVSLRTLRRWQTRPEFQEALREGARASFRETNSLLMALARDSLQALWRVVLTGSEAQQVRAALGALDLAYKAEPMDLDVQMQQLRELREQLEEELWNLRDPGEPEPRKLRALDET
jgi:DNA-binding transcriptional MerR regulator